MKAFYFFILLFIMFGCMFGLSYYMEYYFKDRILELEQNCSDCIIKKTYYNITFSEFYNETNTTVLDKIRNDCNCCKDREDWTRTMRKLDSYAK